ncbi:MAG: hypothetical protein K2L72_05560, partial [Clostridia bacterium]|nr:hypothetical protein [Clostridia bacterium]
FHVFVDNFSTIYKLLLYRLIVIAITVGLCCAVIIPTLNNILSTAQYEELSQTFSALWADLIALNTETLHEKLQAVLDAVRSFNNLLDDKSWLVAIAACCLSVVYLIDRFLVGVGNYVTGALLNDRMVMHANSSFTFTLFKNIKKALLYSVIYAPIAFVYDMLCMVIIWSIISVGLGFVPIALVKIFLVAVLFIMMSAVKFTFTVDWLPALIHGRMNNRKAIAYTFSRRGKRTASVLSNALVFKTMLIALNVAALFFTFGAGLLITMPASALIQLSYSFVNYFDANRKKYFVDEYTVIGPKKEAPVTLKEFFKGDDED